MNLTRLGPVLAVCAALSLAPAARAGSLEPVAKFYAGQTHLDLEVYRAADGSALGLITIENPLRIRGQPTASIALQPAQWPELIALWTRARSSVTGAEPWTPVGDIAEFDGSSYPARLSLSSGPDVRFALGQAGGALAFELSTGDVEAMDQALAREQAMLQTKSRPGRSGSNRRHQPRVTVIM
jgi:hypothetical protein